MIDLKSIWIETDELVLVYDSWTFKSNCLELQVFDSEYVRFIHTLTVL